MIFLIETPREVFWSPSKMDRDFKHAVEFLYRDKARAKQMTPRQFDKFKKQAPKTVHAIVQESEG
jgi:hypothetical protein